MVNTEPNCVNGCTDWEWIYSFPSVETDNERYLEWLCLFGIHNTTNEALYACERHFSPQMRLENKCFLRKDALPDRNFDIAAVSETTHNQQFFSQCVRVSQNALVAEANQSLVVPTKKPKLNGNADISSVDVEQALNEQCIRHKTQIELQHNGKQAAKECQNETTVAEAAAAAPTASVQPNIKVHLVYKQHTINSNKKSTSPPNKLNKYTASPNNSNGNSTAPPNNSKNNSQLLRELLKKPTILQYPADTGTTVPGTLYTTLENSTRNGKLQSQSEFDKPVSIVPVQTALQIAKRLKDISVEPSKPSAMAFLNAAPNDSTFQVTVLNEANSSSTDDLEEETSRGQLTSDFSLEEPNDEVFRMDLLAFCIYKCHVCEKEYVSPNLYSLHMECKHAWQLRESLGDYLKSITSQLFYCQTSFNRPISYPMALFGCVLCNVRKLDSTWHLQEHIREQHPVLYKLLNMYQLPPKAIDEMSFTQLRSKLTRLFKYTVSQVFSPRPVSFKNSWYLCLGCDKSEFSLLELAKHAYVHHQTECKKIVMGSIYIEVQSMQKYQQGQASADIAKQWQAQLELLKVALQYADVIDDTWLQFYMEPLLLRFGVTPSLLTDKGLAEQLTKEFIAIFSSSCTNITETAVLAAEEVGIDTEDDLIEVIDPSQGEVIVIEDD